MFTIGCDPELFLVNAAGDLVSAIDRVGGSKEFPRPIEGAEEGFCVQEDNVAVEFNIPPAGSEEEFTTRVQTALNLLRKELGDGQGLAFSSESAVFFPVLELGHPKAQEFGCDPDFDAWNNGKVNPRPKAEDPTLRSAGGHIHVGYKFKNRKEVERFIRLMDVFVGVPCTLIDNGELRKSLYGKRGAFRYKPYGCEYRTPSNFWVLKEETTRWVYRQVEQALKAFENGMKVEEDDHQIADAINNNNKTAAAFLVNKYQVALA